jgi:putative Mn2+ efflux pump MntP
MKKLELVLIIGAVVGLVMMLFNVPLDSMIVSVFFITLGCLYFYLGFALLNDIRFRDIFKADSYKGLGIWRILIAIGSGIASSWLTIGLMFSILNYPMAGTFLIVGIVFAAIMITLALIRNMRDKNKFYRNVILRCFVFIIIGVIFLLLPGQIFESL